MAYFSLLDTSLDLNANPMTLMDEVPIKMIQSNSNELRRKKSVKEEKNAIEEELNRVNEENKKLTEKLTELCENYNALRSHLMDYMTKNPPGASEQSHVVGKKRKSESPITTNNGGGRTINGGNNVTNSDQSSSSDEDSSCNKKPKAREEEHVKNVKTSKVYVRTEASDTTSLVVKDGYQWRKYGQKVTRDNPCPRAYFKCSFAPTCPVKKKVQRSVEDQSLLVATYEGEHNHPYPSRVDAVSSSNRCVTLGSTPCPPSITSSGPTITVDLKKPKSNSDAKIPSRGVNPPEFQQFLVEQMASSLTNDPSFKAAVAAAISGRFLQHNQTEKW